MAFYQIVAKLGQKFIAKHTLFKLGFNLAPMYRRSTARITEVSTDLMTIKVRLPISYKNRNYVGSIFGGSMFSAVDPIPMVQLLNLLDQRFVVWDKSAEIVFKAPAKEDLHAEFTYTTQELEQIQATVGEQEEMEIVKTTLLTNREQTKTYSEVRKTIYVCSKAHYKTKLAARQLRIKPKRSWQQAKIFRLTGGSLHYAGQKFRLLPSRTVEGD